MIRPLNLWEHSEGATLLLVGQVEQLAGHLGRGTLVVGGRCSEVGSRV